MAKVSIGKPIPKFTATITGDTQISNDDLKGRNVILYFYPRDNTPGCTQEGKDFNTLLPKLTKLNTLVLGISRDKLATHERFKEKQGFKFDLITDTEEKLCKLFDVIKLKNMYGKQVLGIERSTFLIDDKGILRNEWRKVKVAGHAEEVFDAVKAL